MNLLPYRQKLTPFERETLIRAVNTGRYPWVEEPEVWFMKKHTAVSRIQPFMAAYRYPLVAENITDMAFLNILWVIAPDKLTDYKKRIARRGNKHFGITPPNKR